MRMSWVRRLPCVKWTVDRKVAAGFAVTVAAVLVLGVLTAGTTIRLIRMEDWVAQTQQVLTELQGTLSSVKEAEISQRGYVLTGDEHYLRPYERAARETAVHLDRLAALTAREPSQRRRVNELRQKISERETAMARVVELRRRSGLEPARAMVTRGVGRKAMDDVRHLAAEMAAEQNALLARRSEDSDQAARDTLWGMLFLTVLSFASMGAAYVLMRRDLLRRRRAETGLRRANEQLVAEVAERARAEEALARQAAELKRQADALKRQAEELARSNADLERFAYVASHDLQEPLRMVASYTQLLAERYRGRLDADADEFIGYAVDGARRMSGLIRDLLAYSRIGSAAGGGSAGGGQKSADCYAAVATTLDNLRGVVRETGARVTAGRLPESVAVDPTQLVQLLQNLVANAIKFRRGDGEGQRPEISVSAEYSGDGQWTFSVRDNGIGIEPRFADKIFVIFRRLHRPQEYPGNGIGLAICKRIVERHGGRIWVEPNREGTPGSNFRFTLPASAPSPSSCPGPRLRLAA